MIECENFSFIRSHTLPIKEQKWMELLTLMKWRVNQRLSCLWKQLETQNRRFLIDWSRSVKWRRQVCSGCLWRTWHQWEENCWTFTNGIQQNCILFYRKRWWNFLQSDWKKEALERPRRRNGYSVQAVLDIFKQETRWKTWCAHCCRENQDSSKIWTSHLVACVVS